MDGAPWVCFCSGIHPSWTWISGSFESMRWNAYKHRLDLALDSDPQQFQGSGVKPVTLHHAGQRAQFTTDWAIPAPWADHSNHMFCAAHDSYTVTCAYALEIVHSTTGWLQNICIITCQCSDYYYVSQVFKQHHHFIHYSSRQIKWLASVWIYMNRKIMRKREQDREWYVIKMFGKKAKTKSVPLQACQYHSNVIHCRYILCWMFKLGYNEVIIYKYMLF